MDSILEIDNLTFGYSANQLVFSNASFTMESGKIYGLIAPNGAGKTTLLDLIYSHRKPINGNIVWHKSMRNAFYLKQHIDIPRALKIREFTELVLRINGVEEVQEKLAIDIFDDWRERYQKIGNRKAGNTSMGEKRWINVMCALSLDRDILFMDEPTSWMDTLSRIKLWEYIKAQVDRNKLTVLVTSHHMDEIKKYIDTLIIIKDEKIKAFDSIEEFTSYYKHGGSIDDAFAACFDSDKN